MLNAKETVATVKLSVMAEAVTKAVAAMIFALGSRLCSSEPESFPGFRKVQCGEIEPPFRRDQQVKEGNQGLVKEISQKESRDQPKQDCPEGGGS